MSRFAILTIALFTLLAAPARGAGGPVAGYDALGLGVTARGLHVRYVAVRAHGNTVVTAIDRHGGQVVNARYFDRRWYVPAAAYDGSTTGLAAAGGLLVLTAERTAYPARHSEFLVLETPRLRRVATISLRGDFSLDAISPDGNRLYFIQVLSDTRYLVRAYDYARRTLLRDPVVDPTDKEPLRGSPLSRALSPDSRWAYTLYDGNSTHPFIHALDTVRGQAKCIDLDALAGREDLFDMRLKVSGAGTLLVRDGSGRAVLAVDPRSFAVREPRPVAPRPAAAPPDDGGPGWSAPLAGLALLALLAVFALRAGRERYAPRMR